MKISVDRGAAGFVFVTIDGNPFSLAPRSPTSDAWDAMIRIMTELAKVNRLEAEVNDLKLKLEKQGG